MRATTCVREGAVKKCEEGGREKREHHWCTTGALLNRCFCPSAALPGTRNHQLVRPSRPHGRQGGRAPLVHHWGTTGAPLVRCFCPSAVLPGTRNHQAMRPSPPRGSQGGRAPLGLCRTVVHHSMAQQKTKERQAREICNTNANSATLDCNPDPSTTAQRTLALQCTLPQQHTLALLHTLQLHHALHTIHYI